MLRALDLRLLRVLRTRGHHPALERGAIVLSRTGEHGLLWLAIAGVGALVDRRRRAVYRRAARAVLAGYLANQATKLAVRRARPLLEGFEPLVVTFSGRSYPSAHTTTSVAGARVLGDALPRWPLRGLATAIALSRPYLGVHYPSDVVAGALLGRAVADLTP